MTTNFHFLTPQWPALAEVAAKVEGFAKSDPRTACFWARRALELAVS
jgi:type I restriction enzyme, R subunit